jgi:hypothetical protein
VYVNRGGCADTYEAESLATARFRMLPRPAGGVSWRLLATNNRDLGRGPVAYPTREACRDALRWLQRHAGTLEAELNRTGPSAWSWRLVAGGEVVAVASRDYQRRIQATQSAAIALDLIPGAEIDGDGPRAGETNPRAGTTSGW